MADEGVRGSVDSAGDSDFCTAILGARRAWTDGAYTVTCGTCGNSFREATDHLTGESVVLHRPGGRWVEWTGAPPLSALVGGRSGHPRGSGRAFDRGIHERQDV